MSRIGHPVGLLAWIQMPLEIKKLPSHLPSNLIGLLSAAEDASDDQRFYANCIN